MFTAQSALQCCSQCFNPSFFTHLSLSTAYPSVTHALSCLPLRPPSVPSSPPPPLLLLLLLHHQGLRRFSALATATRNGQHHKDSVIPRITQTLDRNHSWQAISAFSRDRLEKVEKWDQKKESGSALWTTPSKINKVLNLQPERALCFHISLVVRPKTTSAQWKKTWMKGRPRKVRKYFLHIRGDFLKWIWHGVFCQRVSGASAETNAQMLAFPFLNRRAAVCGNSFVHWVSALHWRVHVCMCCLGSQRGVNCFSEGWTVFVCLIRFSCLSQWLREKHEEWRTKPSFYTH